MSDPNIYVSNGTCYTAAGKKLDDSFIPCGNDAFGHQTCCGAGDNCLADNACFGVHGSGYGSFLTYMAGCTDPDYKDATCPDKKDIDQPWIALTLCDDSGGEWAACSQEGNPSTLQPGSFCSCTNAASATVAFSDSTSLTNICSLPQSTGASIQFIAGHFPTSPAAAGTTAEATGAATSGGSAAATQTGQNTVTQDGTGAGNSGTTVTRTVSVTPPPSNTPTDPSGTSFGSGTSSSTKIGIGVGVAVGTPIILAIVIFLLLLRRRRRRLPATEAEKGTANAEGVSAASVTPRVSDVGGPLMPEADGKPVSKADQPGVLEAGGDVLVETDGKGVSKADKPGVAEADGQAILETDGTPARPWSMRSELEGSQVPNPALRNTTGGHVRRNEELSPVAELQGNGDLDARGQAPEQGGQGSPHASAPPEWGAAWRVQR